MASSIALEKAAQAWCTPETSHLVMIPKLAEAFADIIDKILMSGGLPPSVLKKQEK